MWYFNPPKWPLGNISRMNEYSLPKSWERPPAAVGRLARKMRFFTIKAGIFACGVPEMPIFMTDNPNPGP